MDIIKASFFIFCNLLINFVNIGISDTVKAGNCPADRVGKTFRSDVKCSSDSDCEGKNKCCLRAGKPVCRSPDTDVPGACPEVVQKNSGASSTFQCDSDFDCCHRKKKCCPTETGGYACKRIKESTIYMSTYDEPSTSSTEATKSTTILDKGDGRCPDPVNVYQDQFHCNIECEMGKPCFVGDFEGICCGSRCNGSICKIIAPEKPGDCPPYDPHMVAACAAYAPGVPLPWSCQHDIQCNGTQICCKGYCEQARCTDPAAPVIKFGVCPKSDTISTGSSLNECKTDAGCWGGLKCCQRSDGTHTCTSPEQDSRCPVHFDFVTCNKECEFGEPCYVEGVEGVCCWSGCFDGLMCSHIAKEQTTSSLDEASISSTEMMKQDID